MIVLLAAVALLSQDPEPALNCGEASSTLEINDCAMKDLAVEQARMNAYLEEAVAVLREEAETPEQAQTVITQLRASQKLWADYADSACQTVYTRWQGGTIRTLMALDCRKALTLQRTHALWADYLNYMDSTPPRLPEPLPPSSDDVPVNADD